ncbi:glutathione S-transferase N-terminal domain-containing protein [Halovenus salina]|uniref:Glutathione S-transferase N-terminal domain-containing protein n=1 Tax=Halovenus salina TaxID=1510225 RepID=A0ABD5W2G8_9EURY|nr:glutathione S-transferase N-terminal domain-containing protein [Halovenus salina]
MSTIELYDREDCPYSKKVRDKLDELDLDYDETLVPDAHSERSEVEEVTGQTGVPAILDNRMDEEFLADSDEIIRYLERQYS